MSLVSLFTARKRVIGGTQGVQIDAVLTEMENNTITVTSSPIETGANINDHAIVQPRLYRMEGIVSDTERGNILGGEETNILQNAVNNLVNDLTGNVFNPLSNGKRSQSAYEELLKLMWAREPFTIQTGLSSIQNVIITNLTTNKEKSTGKALHFIAELQQLIIVDNKETQIKSKDLKEGPTKQQATPEVNKGTLYPDEFHVGSDEYRQKSANAILDVLHEQNRNAGLPINY